MNLFESLALVLVIMLVSASIAYNMQKGTPTMGNFTEDLDQDLEEKPKAKSKAKASDKVFPTEAAINQDGVDVEFEPVKPKKKRKYYPKKPKTQK
jgi:hypothetical protein